MRVHTIPISMELRREGQSEKQLIDTNNKHGGLFMWELRERKERIENYSEILPWMAGLKIAN